MANPRYDLAVIGSGPGGYVAAIRASQLKMKTAVIERDRLGGVCLNWGCIPSKALLNSAEAMETIRAPGKEHGIEVGEVRVNFKRVIARSREAAEKLSKGVRFLLKKNNIDMLEANATITGPHTIALSGSDGKAPPVEAIEAERILIATGSTERLFPGMTVGDGLITSKEALVNDRLPQDLLVIGAGAIGLEFAYFYQAFGVKVTIAELEKQMLPGLDAEVAEELRRAFVKRKVAVMLGHGYKSIARKGERWAVTLDAAGSATIVEADAVLVAVGRLPLTGGLGFDHRRRRAGARRLRQDRRSFPHQLPEHLRDRRRGPPSPARAQGFGRGRRCGRDNGRVREPGFNLSSVAACTYCQPEVATIGLSEADAKARNIEVKVGKFPFRALGKAVAINHVEGFVKLVASKQYGEILGCQIIGHGATDMISEIALGKTLEATTTELGHTIHPHPTLAEAIMEAALAAEGEAINF